MNDYRKRRSWLWMLILLVILAIGCQKQTGDQEKQLNQSSSQSITHAQSQSQSQSQSQNSVSATMWLKGGYEQLKEEQPERVEELEKLVFYRGSVSIDEDQSWKSKFQDGSHGEGPANFICEEYCVYDPITKKVYIIARKQSYISDHVVTVNDLQGTLVGQKSIGASGELTECYGIGNFSTMPIRMDQETKEVFVLPPTYNTQWVGYRTTGDTVRWSIERLGPAESAVNTELIKLPNVEQLKDSKTYGNRKDLIYEGSRRFWTIKGRFSYQYNRISAKEAVEGFLSYLDEVAQQELTQSDKPKPSDALKDLLTLMSSKGIVVSSDEDAQLKALAALADSAHSLNTTSQVLTMLLKQLAMAEPEIADLKELGSQSETVAIYKKNVDLTLEKAQKGIDALSPFSSRPAYKSFESQWRANAKEYTNFWNSDSFWKNHVDLLDKAKPFANYVEHYEGAMEELMSLGSDLGSETARDEVINRLLSQAFGAPKAIDLTEEGTSDLPEGYPVDLLPKPTGGRLSMAEPLGDGGYMAMYIVPGTMQEIESQYIPLLKKGQGYQRMALQGNVIFSVQLKGWEVGITLMPNQLTQEGGTVLSFQLIPL